MKKLLIALGLFFASCTSVPFLDPEEPAFIAPMQTEIMEAETERAAPTIIPTPTEFVPEPERTNWLILGGDYRAHRGVSGNKTDVIVLISILETDPIDIAVIQFPRNLYLPIEGMEDQWLFAVWSREGWQGLHTYFQRALGISLQGIHFIHMDNFEKVVDDLGGVNGMSGSETLSYLRDNTNNWELGSYDAGQRVFKVLSALWERGSTFFLSDPVAAANIVYSQWGDLFETDLSNIQQLYWLFRLGWKVKNSDYEIRWIQLEEPFIVRGDTPIIQDEKPMRGMIATLDLSDWFRDCVFDQVCEADK